MKKQMNEAKREELAVEYNSNLKKNEMRLGELEAKARKIEECCDELHSFRTGAKSMLSHHQSELVQYGSHEDLEMFHRIEEELQQDCFRTETALLEEKNEVERERKQIFRDREDMESEYQRAAHVLDGSN